MHRNWRLLLQPYEMALRRHLAHGGSADLKPALRLGRKAMAMGLETLDLALIHEQALIAQILLCSDPLARARIVNRAKIFFTESIIPIESTHRTAMEANVSLSRINMMLRRRTMELSSSNRDLKKEISKRQVVEGNLRRSEQHASGLLEKSRSLQKQLRLLSRHVLSAQEEERKRISRELHDVIAQMLTGINVRLATLKVDATSSTKDLDKKISRTQRLVERSVDVVHRFARELRPAVLDHLGLIPALHSFMKSFSKETGIRVSLTAFTGLEELSSTKRTTLYRVAQEALSNVARHAQASHAKVLIKRIPNAVRMDICDNGKGFDAKQDLFVGRSRRLGLLGLRERVEMVNGTFTVASVPGRGTTVSAQIPFGGRL